MVGKPDLVAMPFDVTKEQLQSLHNLSKEPAERSHALEALGGAAGIAQKLSSDFQNGVFPSSCKERQESFGKNEYAQPVPKTFYELCIDALNDTTMIILCASAGLSLLIGVVKGGEWYQTRPSRLLRAYCWDAGMRALQSSWLWLS